MFIGDSIEEFKTTYYIEKLVSNVGNNVVPYPYAYAKFERGIYMYFIFGSGETSISMFPKI